MRPADEVMGGDSAGEEGTAQHKPVVLSCHVRGVAEGARHILGGQKVGVDVDVERDALGEHLFQEQADVERDGDGIGEGEQLARAGAVTDAVGLVRRPVQRGEAIRMIRQRDEATELAPVQGRGGGTGVVGVRVGRGWWRS